MKRAAWIRGIVIGALMVLVLGRWAAVWSADRWWSEALGVLGPYDELYQLRTYLIAAVMAISGAWCIGNLFLVFQSIHSVQVPRRVADIEIVEAIPRRYLAWAVVVLGVLLALALSGGAGEWWRLRALAQSEVVTDLRDPILDRDAAYYLFQLPWLRSLHGYVTLASGVILGVVLLLYAAVGAVRIEGRRLIVSDLARRHVGALLAVFAAALVWGYRLEPMEFVAGFQPVPIDAVLTEVRLPTSRLLGAFALTALAASLLWIRYDRIAVPVFGWMALVAFSLVGHYVVPSVAARARSSSELRLPGLTRWESRFSSLAYGLPDRDAGPWDVSRGPATVPEEFPVWDGFAALSFMNEVAHPTRYSAFHEAWLGSYGADGRPVPVFVGVPEVDLTVARARDPGLTWEDVHVGQYSATQGVVVIRADQISEAGLPNFVPDLRHPDVVTPMVSAVDLRQAALRFTPGATEYAADTSASNGITAGVRLGGLLRRFAIAWRLQTTKVISSPALDDDAVVLWHRGVVERLERFAPFIEFDDVYPVIESGGVWWVAYGYVVSTGFPVTRPVTWRGSSVRYLRAGFVGVVDGFTGATAVYALADADPLSRAWASRFPDIVRPSSALPRGIEAHLRYPSALFSHQLEQLSLEPPRTTAVRQAGPQLGGSTPSASPFWWLDSAGAAGFSPLRRMSPLEFGDPPMLAGMVEGRMRAGVAVLDLRRLRTPLTTNGPTQVQRDMSAFSDGDGSAPAPAPTLRGAGKMFAAGAGVVAVQAVYSDPAAGERSPPRLVNVVAEWNGSVGEGPTAADAVRDAIRRAPLPDTVHPEWQTAREWLKRLDTARRTGDWRAFGEAYEHLLRLFEITRDTVPDPG